MAASRKPPRVRPQDGSEGDFRTASAAATSYEELRIRGRTHPGLYHPVRRCPPERVHCTL
uniref:X-prolyl aminopeptidase (aminopeptidase P) 1, soluble n=1 Tax=Mus musculus TaxID=10090 RepID=S4R167_MOUSE